MRQFPLQLLDGGRDGYLLTTARGSSFTPVGPIWMLVSSWGQVDTVPKLLLLSPIWHA